ncbi:AMP-binding protein, partial [Nocardioides hankookensis]
DGLALVARLRRSRVTVLSMVPTAFRYLVGDGSAAELPDLRWLVLGGEAADVAPTLEWAKGSDRLVVVNMYGLTEGTVHATHLALTASAPGRPGSTPIGRPLAHLDIEVLDTELRPCPTGVVGELVISGSTVARGYWRRPDLSAARFVDRHGALSYRTGDLGYRDSAGDLHHVGRADDQVQVRGYRIEPSEITATAAAHPDVADAVTLPFTNAAGDLDLACHFRPRADREPVDLRTWLAHRLPAY